MRHSTLPIISDLVYLPSDSFTLIVGTAISIPSFVAGISSSPSNANQILNNNVAIPLMDCLGVILSLSLCLLVLRVKIFSNAYHERDVRTLSDWQVRSNRPEAAELRETRLPGVGASKSENENETIMLELPSTLHPEQSSSSVQLSSII